LGVVGEPTNLTDTLVEQLTYEGNGNYAYIDNLEEARKLFVEDLTSILQVIYPDSG
jgi:Ca-activated chloride channel family protein